MFGGSEEWSTGFFVGSENQDAQDPTQGFADAIRNAWATYHASAGALVGTGYLFRTVKLAAIDATGHTELDQVVYSHQTPALAGNISGTTLRLPPQNTLVATLYSDRVRGRASKGRMYLPGVTTGVEADGKILSSKITTLSTNLETFFQAVLTAAPPPDVVILAAKGTGALPALNAQNEPVIGIRVGDVMDTQRRRRNSLVESYVEQPFAA